MNERLASATGSCFHRDGRSNMRARVMSCWSRRTPLADGHWKQAERAVEVEALGTAAGKAGIVVVKRRYGRPTPPLVMMTADAYGRLTGGGRQPGGRPHDPCLCLAAAGLGH